MVGRGRQVTIQFLGDAKGLVSAANSAGRSTSTLGDKLKRVGTAALIGFAGAAVVAAKAGLEFTEMAIDDQKSQVLMANAIHQNTDATNKQISATEDWITKQGQLLGVTDDELRPAISKMVQATGDLSKSQSLVGLAMDVAAGRGKTLQQVTDALARAQTGSLTGLGRLGVATKDAAGNTKSLAEITDELTKKYAGSAATAADSAAGKYQRLKVELSETAEGIGYKLLPVANQLGDWLLKDGVPALEGFAQAGKRELGPMLHDLVDWVKENKGELHDLGSEVMDTVVPAMQEVGHFIGEAVDFFSKLPDPVKRTAAEIGLAAVVIPKLSGALNGLNGSLGLGTSKLAGWRRGLLMAAGVGGVAAMTEGAKEGNKAVSLLGDALTGAFIGGTLGSAIPGVGTAIGAAGGAAVGAGIGFIKMHKGEEAAGNSADAAKPQIDALRETLNQTTGATTKYTKALVLQRLQQDGIVDSAGQLGIATSDLIKASMGNQKAIERVSSAWEAQGGIVQGLQNQKITDWIYGMRGQMVKAKADVEKTNSALDGTDRAARDAGNALKGVGKDRPVTNKWAAYFQGDMNDASGSVGKWKQIFLTAMGQAGRSADTSKAKIHGVSTEIGNLKNKDVFVTTHLITVHGSNKPAQGPQGEQYDGKSSGKTLADRLFGGKGDLEKQGQAAEAGGMGLIIRITKGLKKGERTLKNVLAGIHDYIKTKTDQLTSLLSDRNSFADSFRSSFSESIFGASFSDAEGNSLPPTMQRIMDFAKQQQSNAHALAANVKSLMGRGLSRDLLSQLASQGQSGYDQIAALATGTDAEIQSLNATNSDIKSTLESLGLDLYNAINPDQAQQIDLLKQQIASANRQEQHLQHIADSVDRGDDIRLQGSDLVIMLHRLSRTTGVQYLVS